MTPVKGSCNSWRGQDLQVENFWSMEIANWNTGGSSWEAVYSSQWFWWNFSLPPVHSYTCCDIASWWHFLPFCFSLSSSFLLPDVTFQLHCIHPHPVFEEIQMKTQNFGFFYVFVQFLKNIYLHRIGYPNCFQYNPPFIFISKLWCYCKG